MKIGVIICLSTCVLWAALAIVQLWFEPMSAEVFIKISITAGVITTVTLLVTLAIREYLSNKVLKDKNYID